jgi:hypothetical protein
MRRFVRPAVALFAFSLSAIVGCGNSAGGSGDPCNTPGSTSECQSGYVCAGSGSGGDGTSLTCRQECTLATNCNAVERCEVAGAGNGLKVCRAK